MINNIGADKSQFDAKMRGIGELMRFYEVPRALHERVLDFYAF